MTGQSPSVVQALAKVMAEVRSLGKDSVNPNQGYRFRGIDAVMNAVGPALRAHGIVPMPNVETCTYRDVRTSQDKPARECTVTVRYRFYGPNGDHVECITPGESLDFGDKGAAKAMSVAYRIALLQVLCLPTDEPDPDEHTYERAGAPAAPNPLAVRAQALAPDVTFDGISTLHRTCYDAGLLQLPTKDEEGNDTTLGELLIARGNEVRSAVGSNA